MSLTEQQAYDAMFLFLEEYWERGRREDDDIAALLGSMNRGLWSERTAADPAMFEDWKSCVQRIQGGLDPYGRSA